VSLRVTWRLPCGLKSHACSCYDRALKVIEKRHWSSNWLHHPNFLTTTCSLREEAFSTVLLYCLENTAYNTRYNKAVVGWAHNFVTVRFFLFSTYNDIIIQNILQTACSDSQLRSTFDECWIMETFSNNFLPNFWSLQVLNQMAYNWCSTTYHKICWMFME